MNPDIPSRPLHIFLCHSTGDKPAVRDLYKRLRTEGFDPWLDEENLEAGQEWEKEIPRAVRDSDVVIVCLSRGSVNKRGYVQREIKFALDVAEELPEGSIFLIPLRLEDCDVPERLSRWQWVNLFEARGYTRLIRALRLCAYKSGIMVEPTQVSRVGISGGINQTITLLFADIRGFTSLTEGMSPEKVVQLLNNVHSTLSRIIIGHRGIIHLYLGEGLMALFGVPAATPKDASNAVEAAVAMQRQMVRINEELPAMGLPEVSIAIGIHTGEATVGINGTEIRSEYTVIGNTVNTASRLESHSQGKEILLSEETVMAAVDIQWPLRQRAPIIVKDRAQPVSLWEVDWQHESDLH